MAQRALQPVRDAGLDRDHDWFGPAISAAVEQLSPRVVRIRHALHRTPELSNREFETAARVARHLRCLGLEVTEKVAHTGVVGILRGAHPGPTVAVRADMDALPVTEATSLPFRSRVRTEYQGREVGVSHACGHDVHTAVLLGVASVLTALRGVLPGAVKFIFQPAEEGAPVGEEGGAALMIAEGVLEGPAPAAIFGLHTFPDLNVGEIGYTPGAAWAAVDRFSATLRGVPAHGAHPEVGVDPVVMAAEAVVALQTIRSRSIPANEPAVVTVGRISGGERFNIIPADVEIEGTVRTYSDEVRTLVERRLREVLDGVCHAHGGGNDLRYERLTPTLVNAPELADRVLDALGEAVGRHRLVELPPSMGGEDFAYFAAEVPGFYFRLGSLRPGGNSGGFHTPTFEADDACIPVGMRAMSGVVLDYLGA